MGERLRRWVVGCRDPFGRRSTVRVVHNDGEILLVAPPGECAVLDERSAAAAGRALKEASYELETHEDPTEEQK